MLPMCFKIEELDKFAIFINMTPIFVKSDERSMLTQTIHYR